MSVTIIWGRPINVELRELLEALKIEALLQGRGQYIQQTSNSPNDIFITCPNYEAHGGPEHTPSCAISKEEGLVHCFGCGYHTSLPGLVSDILGFKNPVKGFQWIRRKFSAPAVGHRKSLLSPDIERDKKKIYVPEEALLQYNFDHPYMYKRRLTPEVIDWFSIGYDEESHSITIPVKDVDGRIAFIKKRSVKRSKFGKYLIEEGADKREIVFGLFMVKRCLPKVDMVFLSEGEMDVLSWYSIEKYGAGLQGSDLFADQKKELIRVVRGKPICLAFDNDKAGLRCRSKCIEELSPYFRLLEIVYPRGSNYKDPNALLQAGKLDSVEIVPVRNI